MYACKCSTLIFSGTSKVPYHTDIGSVLVGRIVQAVGLVQQEEKRREDNNIKY